MKIKLVASDLDGTLLLDNKTISKRTEEVLKRMLADGIEFVPATGRAFGTIPKELRELPGVKYAIASNGAAIYDAKSGERMYQCLLTEEAVKQILKYERPDHVIIEAFVDGKAYSERRYVEAPKKFGASDFGEKYVKETRHPEEDIEAFVWEHRNRMESISFVCEEKAVLLKIEKELKELIPDIETTSSVPHMLEIGNKNAGKGGTLRHLLEMLHISPEEAMAFGDADNDLGMLKAVKYGIAMENAVEICKNASYEITFTNEKDGVAIYCEKNLFDIKK